MPTQEDLMGFGMAHFLAAELGNDYQAVTAAGTTQATAALMKGNDYLVEMIGANGSNGIIFPTGQKIGTPWRVFNSNGSNAGLIYVPVGSSLNTVLNGSLSLPALKSAEFVQYKLNNWMYNQSL